MNWIASLAFKCNPDLKITVYLITVTNNILRMKTFVHLLGSQTKRAILSVKRRSILTPRVPNRSVGFRSCGTLAEFAI